MHANETGAETSAHRLLRKKWRVALFKNVHGEDDDFAAQLAAFANRYKLEPGHFMVVGRKRGVQCDHPTEVLYLADKECKVGTF